MAGDFSIDGGSHYFDQTQAEAVAALRRERKGFWLSALGQDVFAFSVVQADADEIVQFLKDIIASAQVELDRIETVLET